VSAAPLGFKRVVLGLYPGAPSRAMDPAVAFAELLQIELLGLFIEDAGLRHLTGIPFAREISSLGGAWRPVEASRALHDLDLAAGRAARRFDEAAQRLARRQFEVVRGGAAESLASVSRSGDIVVIAAPAAAERFAEPFASLIAAAFRSAAAVMLAPPRPARHSGPIAAIAAAPDDPSVAVAAAIAAAAGEELVVVDLAGDPALPEALRRIKERLAVATRGVLGVEIALALAAALGVPVLSIDAGERRRFADDCERE